MTPGIELSEDNDARRGGNHLWIASKIKVFQKKVKVHGQKLWY